MRVLDARLKFWGMRLLADNHSGMFLALGLQIITLASATAGMLAPSTAAPSQPTSYSTSWASTQNLFGHWNLDAHTTFKVHRAPLVPLVVILMRMCMCM